MSSDDLWLKACRAANAAQLLYEKGSHEGACNRAYYAMFNAARALLARQGHQPDAVKTHATVLRLFSLHYAKSGLFQSEHGRALAEAARFRKEADYSTSSLDPEATHLVMRLLDRFMGTAERIIGENNGPEKRNS